MNAVAEREQDKQGTAERQFVAPDVNIYEMPDGYVLEAEMPGVPKNGIEITLEGNTLTFLGRRREQEIKGTALYRESRPADFRRVFELDPAIDTEKIEAEMKQGLLVLKLPKAERVKPRRIEIK